MSIYFLVDINNAYLSMHAVYLLQHGHNIDIRKIPAVIGGQESSRHGIVLAKSDISKQLGVKTGMTLWEARNLCPDLICIPPRYDIYIKSSRAMNDILKSYCAHVEPYSIDESFLSFEGHGLLYNDYIELAHKIKEHIFDELGFSVNIGISYNKLLAKVSSGFKKPNMVHTLLDEEEIKRKMFPLDIRELHGIGASTEKKLRRYGINKIQDIVNYGPEFMRDILNSYGVKLYNYCLGIDHSIINDPKHKKIESIGNSSTSRFDITNYRDAYNLITSLSETIGARLRNRNMRAFLVSLSIKDSDFKVIRKQIKLNLSIASTSDIVKYARKLFNELWDNKSPIRHIEVRVAQLVPQDTPRQMLLLEEDSPDDKGEIIDKVIDELRDRFGSKCIMRANILDSGFHSMTGGNPGGSEVPNMRSEL
ncbi:MAG: DNA polymerase IV [Tissierellales bacterium]|jgi:DNA polymerase-4|nr:DNA polymerase IV [Tissierellales bacterium]